MVSRARKKLLVIGSGGREHALVWKLAQSPHVEKIYVAPGNPGTAAIGNVENVDIQVTDFSKLTHLAYKEDIYLTIVGPDDPLGQGIVDVFKDKGLRIWGPREAAAKLEASKAFSKDFMSRHNIPTAAYKTFTLVDDNVEQTYNEACDYVQEQGFPIVIKASGLALGKGVAIVHNMDEAKEFLSKILIERVFEDAGNQVVIEEYLVGPEISIHVFSDGTHVKLLPSAQDHKPIGDGDLGPNTGGMGTITPLPWLNDEQMKNIEEAIVKPTIAGMKSEARSFVGLLYPGLIMTAKGPKVLEYNVRFGDPETQVYMRTLKTDLFEIVEACVDGCLVEQKIEWSNQSAACIVLASDGYPGTYEKGLEISGIEAAEEDPSIVVFQAGTKIGDDKLLTNGGRVLGVTALANTLEEALEKAYKAADKIQFKGKYCRKDIGIKSLKCYN